MSFKYYIFLFFPFFLLFYSEGINLGGLTVSQLWKLPLLVYLVYSLFQFRHRETNAWSQGYYWLAIKYLFNSGSLVSIAANIQLAIRFLFLPLLYNFTLNKDYKVRELKNVTLVISQYFILTNIPFLTGLLKPMAIGEAYGEFVAYSGIFQNQHAMSVIMGICLCVLIAFFKQGYFAGRWNKIYNIGLMLVAAYAMYLGFARTGWLMCLLGIIIIFIPEGKSVKQHIALWLLGVTLVSGFTYMMETNKYFHNRILGYDSVTNKKLDVGSGRGRYAEVAMDLYYSGNTFELLFGKSMDELMDAEKAATGMRIYAHNGFVTMVVTNGMIGLLLKIVSMILLLIFIWQRKDCDNFRLSLVMWMMNLSFQVTQGGHFFHADLLYALTFVILQLEYDQINRNELNE